MQRLIGLCSLILLFSCSSTSNQTATPQRRESHFADDNSILLYSLGSARDMPATSTQKELQAGAAKNAKAGALGRAMELCRSADPRVYLMECKPGTPKVIVSEETRRMEKELNAAKKLVTESCTGEGPATMCEAHYEIRLPGLRQKCVEFAQRKTCGGI